MKIRKRLILFISILILALCFPVVAQKTVIKDSKAGSMLLGKHKLSLQWISWDYFGTVIVTNRKGNFLIKGRQQQLNSDNFVAIDGRISRVNSKDFIFVGTIITQVDHINGGRPCTREGEMTFRITGKRKYWRLMEMDNPCDGVTDYVDIYFR